MSLSEKYRPRSLADVVGQQAAAQLARFSAHPSRGCFLLHGPSGVGKTATALAFAEDIACSEWSRYLRKSGKLGIEAAEQLFDQTVRFYPMDGHWHVVILEEFERVGSDALRMYLKTALDIDTPPEDGGLARRCIVISTSNDVSKIEPALLQRFTVLQFDAGESFAAAANRRLKDIFALELPWMEMPPGWEGWGWYVGPDKKPQFSMRQSLRKLDGWMLAEGLEVKED